MGRCQGLGFGIPVDVLMHVRASHNRDVVVSRMGCSQGLSVGGGVCVPVPLPARDIQARLYDRLRARLTS